VGARRQRPAIVGTARSSVKVIVALQHHFQAAGGWPPRSRYTAAIILVPDGQAMYDTLGKHMNKLMTAAVVGVLMCASALAANTAPASDASIRQMLELTNARQMLTDMKGQMTAMMNSTMQAATRGQTMTPERQAVLDRMSAKMSALISDSLNWSDLLPLYLRAYRDSFTQDEIDGLIKFYKSAAGQAYVKKLPLVLQNIMREMPEMMKPMQERMMAIQKESLQELKNLQDNAAKK